MPSLLSILKIRPLAWGLLALVAGWGMSRSAVAEEAAPKVVEVKTLLEQLRADDPDRRTNARKALINKGEAIREAVQEALKNSDADLDYQSQLNGLLNELGLNEALKRYDVPKRVTLKVEGATVQEVLDKLKEHYGWSVAAAGVSEKKVTLDLKEVMFFEALEALRQAAGLGYQIKQGFVGAEADGELPVSLCDLGERGVALAQARGPMLLIFAKVRSHSQGEFDLMQGQGSENASRTLEGAVVTEPGLPVQNFNIAEQSFLQPDGTEAAANDQRNGMRSGGFEMHGTKGVYTVQSTLPAGADVKGPLTWKGEVKVEVPLKVQKRTFDVAAEAGKQIQIGNGVLIFQKPTKSGARWEVAFTASGQAGELFGGRQRGMGMNIAMMRAVAVGGGAAAGGADKPAIPENAEGMFWLDADGKLLGGGHSASGNGQSWDVKMNLQNEPKTLVLQWVEDRANRAYRFELPGIPLRPDAPAETPKTEAEQK
ncbi:MAG: hypothetical protein HS116_00805 [Planctomycetes bacterium]|nr:hypothetical protein [Planctomycetota bacterium]